MNLKKIINSISLLGLSSLMFAEENVASQAVQTAADIAVQTTNEFKSMLYLDELGKYLTWGNLAKTVTSLIAIIIFYIVYRIIRKLIKNKASQKMQPHTVGILTKTVSYIFYIIMAVYILGLFGIKLSAVWGAAGVAGLAIGFAAQTSVSNLISGIFVLTEKTMKIGDFIEVDGITGTVDSIGLLSVKIHTLNNQMIRIPNSTIINTKLENYSTHDYRRFVFDFSVDYNSDLDKVKSALNEVVSRCPTVVKDNPTYASSSAFTELGESGIKGCLIVWCGKADFWTTKCDVCEQTIKVFRENNINIPYNRMDVTLLNENTIPSANFKA